MALHHRHPTVAALYAAYQAVRLSNTPAEYVAFLAYHTAVRAAVAAA